jgi:O-antigen ligase
MRIAWEMIKTHPIIGVGLNTFTEVMANYDNTGVSNYLPLPVHNYFLLVTSETGFVGLALFMALIWVSIRIGVSCSLRLTRSLSPIIIGAIGALFASLIANLVDCTLTHYTIGLLFWIILGLLGSCWTFNSQNHVCE